MQISTPGLGKHMPLWKKVYFAVAVAAAVFLAVTLF